MSLTEKNYEKIRKIIFITSKCEIILQSDRERELDHNHSMKSMYSQHYAIPGKMDDMFSKHNVDQHQLVELEPNWYILQHHGFPAI